MNPTKIKTKTHKGGQNFAFLCFRTVDEKQKAMKIFEGYVWKGREVKVKEAKPVMDPMLKRRRDEQNRDPNAPKEKRIKKTVVEATVPLAHMPYEDQIKQKETECLKFLSFF